MHVASRRSADEHESTLEESEMKMAGPCRIVGFITLVAIAVALLNNTNEPPLHEGLWTIKLGTNTRHENI
jgi:hypothetical protein